MVINGQIFKWQDDDSRFLVLSVIEAFTSATKHSVVKLFILPKTTERTVDINYTDTQNKAQNCIAESPIK